MVRESGSQVDLLMVTAYLHDGPCDGETIGMPWPRYELELLRWVGDQFEQTVSDTYRLRPPWRGQQIAHFDYVAPEAARRAA